MLAVIRFWLVCYMTLFTKATLGIVLSRPHAKLTDHLLSVGCGFYYPQIIELRSRGTGDVVKIVTKPRNHLHKKGEKHPVMPESSSYYSYKLVLL